MRFQDKTIIVTGAGSGIGRATALAFGAEGGIVACTDIDQATAERAAHAITEAGGRAQPFVLDTRDPEAVAQFFEMAERVFGRLDVLINSAGIREIESVLDLSPARWSEIIAVNLTGVFLCSQAFAQRVVAKGLEGAIVNLASTLGVTAAPNRAAYTASKHGVVGLTKEMALELATRGVRVNSVCPGVTRTSMTERYFQDEAMSETVRSIHAMKRWGEADEIAKAILFLASDDASFITGESLLVDGGWLAGKQM